jgi:glycosyltransferase involved in cell wall biosynthesis
VPCYNQAVYLPEALQSVLEQTYTNWECIIVNDGSPDNTEEVAKEWMQKDNRIKYKYKPNGGLSSARNAGIEQAKGIYILPLDADDKIANNYIKDAVAVFEKRKAVKVVYCDARLFEGINAKWYLPDFSLSRLAVENPIFCSALFKKEDWERVGGYDTSMHLGFEDWDFWINILKDGGEVFKLPLTGFYYRIRKGSMLRSLSLENRKSLRDYISKKHFDFIAAHIGNPIDLYLEYDKYKNRFIKSQYNLLYRFFRKTKYLYNEYKRKKEYNQL